MVVLKTNKKIRKGKSDLQPDKHQILLSSRDETLIFAQSLVIACSQMCSLLVIVCYF